MPSLSLNIGLNNGRKLPFGGFDADAAAYFITAGVTDATAKQQISDFVVGIKALGFYNNMVCWPLRSAQNAGTGTTAYSLGGLGTYNGTLTNGPTWTADGVTIDNTNDFISTSFSVNQPDSIFAVYYSNTALGSINAVDGTSSRQALNVAIPAFIQCFAGTGIGGTGTSVASMSYHCGVFNGANSIVIQNSTQLATGNAGSNGINTLQIGTFIAGAGQLNGVVACVGAISSALTKAQSDSIYSLYKTTMGSGLGLP
jgi:hypothetical protein